jgi:hypothetical protein
LYTSPKCLGSWFYWKILPRPLVVQWRKWVHRRSITADVKKARRNEKSSALHLKSESVNSPSTNWEVDMTVRNDPEQQTLMELKLDGKVIVRIALDGSVEFSDTITPDEAAKHFWKCVGAVGTDREKLYFDEMNKSQQELTEHSVKNEKLTSAIHKLDVSLAERGEIIDKLLKRIDILNGNGPHQPRGNRFEKIFKKPKPPKTQG